MFDFLRKLLGRKGGADPDPGGGMDPETFLYVKLPGDIQPLERGERFEDPLADALIEAQLGDVTGGGSSMDEPDDDGRPRVEFCGIDVDTAAPEAARRLIREKLLELGAPSGTEIHFTSGGRQLLDRLAEGVWTEGLPRTELHPGFGV